MVRSRWALLQLIAVMILSNCLPTFTALVHAAAGSGDIGGDGHGAKKDVGDKLGLILVKIWCLLIVFVVTFAGGISPYFWRWNHTFIVLGTQFAGGVFLGTALMHFLSDSNQTFQDLGVKDYPFAFMLCSVGYVVTKLADCIVVWANQSNSVGNVCGEGKEEEEEGGEGINGTSNGTNRRRRRPWAGESALLILALSFHSVFEGMAVGVAESKVGAWKALMAVCLHKVFAGVAMAIALLRMMPNRPFLSCAAYAFAFGISSPVGVSIGIVVDSTTGSHVAHWLFAITMGLATGIFIYVALNHLLASAGVPHNERSTTQEEEEAHASRNNNSSTTRGDNDGRRSPSLFNFVAFLLGVGVIAVAMIWDT